MLSPRSTTAFSGGGLDRASTLRTDADAVARYLDDPNSAAVAVSGDAVFVGGGDELAYFELARLAAAGAGPPVLLGLRGDRALFAVDVGARESAVAAALTESVRPLPLREAGEFLPQPDGALAAYAIALVGWHRRHPHCAVCGAHTEIGRAHV